MFDLKNFNEVYYPTKSNEPLKILVDYDLDDGYPVTVTGQNNTFALNGKCLKNDENPVLFPCSSEWYNKLKAVYPNLRPYESDYHSVIKSILANAKTVVCRKSYVNHTEAIKSGALVFVDADTKLFKKAYYVAVNPFTLEVCDSDMDYFTIDHKTIKHLSTSHSGSI